MARESWLASNDHDKFAAAAMRCRNPSAFCMSDGFCHYGGCFRSKRDMARLDEIGQLIDLLRDERAKILYGRPTTGTEG